MTEAPKPPPPAPPSPPLKALLTTRRHGARLALLLALVAVLTLGFSVFGLREAMFDLDYAVGTLVTGWAPALALGAVILGVLAFLLGLIVAPRRDVVTALLAVAMGAGVMAAVAQVRVRVAGNPPIHDVATDWSDPMMFGTTMTKTRNDALADNRVEAAPRVEPQPQDPNLTGAPIAQVNARTCPGATPVVRTGTVAEAYERAKSAVTREGYAVVTDNPEGGRLEATAVTPYLKLVGDVIVRIKPEGAGARVDIRSISRMGVADLGENCRRVTKLRNAISK